MFFSAINSIASKTVSSGPMDQTYSFLTEYFVNGARGNHGIEKCGCSCSFIATSSIYCGGDYLQPIIFSAQLTAKSFTFLGAIGVSEVPLGGRARLSSARRNVADRAVFWVRGALRTDAPYPASPVFFMCLYVFPPQLFDYSRFGYAMKAIRLVTPGQSLVAQEIQEPSPGKSDVVIRVKAAGICHSDAHYRAGKSRVHPLPLRSATRWLASSKASAPKCTGFRPGDRVCVHYLATCGSCGYCSDGNEQFCASASMIGKYRDGGYAEYILMPARSIFHLPAEIPFDQGAIMMCSSATSLHALKKGAPEAW